MYNTGISYFTNAIHLLHKEKKFYYSQYQLSRNENKLNLADYDKGNFLLGKGERDK